MTNEFKKIIKNNETHYVLEDASAGATSAGSVASVSLPLGEIKRRIKKLKERAEKVSVPTTKPRNPTGMGSTPGRGTQVHKDKKHDQKMGKQKHKKAFYEQMIEELEALAELDKPSGSMFLKFRGKRLPGDEMMLLGYGGFGNTPKDVTVGNALVKPFPADDAYDVINKIESLFKDKDFVGVEKIVLDIPGSLSGQLRDVLDYAEQDPERFELYTGIGEGYGSFQGKLDREKDEFKRNELEVELGHERQPYRPAAPLPKGMYFYNVGPGQERIAQAVGLRQTKSGKWFSKYPNPEAGGKFGPGRYWEPKSEGVAEGADVEYIVVIRDEQGKRSIRVSALTPTDAKEKAEARGYKVLKVKDPREANYFREQGVAEGSGPQVGDEVYYGSRLVGWFKGYSKFGKIITEPNVDEMGDEYLNKDAYWDPKGITIKPKQGVAEGPEQNKQWRDQARDASKEKRPWSPTNLPNYKKNKEQGVAEGSEELVQIKYWQQDTMESGRWVKTKPMPRATAEKVVDSFPRGEIVDVEQGVAEEQGYDQVSPKQARYILRLAQDHSIEQILDDFPELFRMMEVIAGERGLHLDDNWDDVVEILLNDLEDIVQQDNDQNDDMSEGLRDPKDNPCWKGYKPVGTKKKGGKTVPNCVPTNEDTYIENLTNKLNSIVKQ